MRIEVVVFAAVLLLLDVGAEISNLLIAKYKWLIIIENDKLKYYYTLMRE